MTLTQSLLCFSKSVTVFSTVKLTKNNIDCFGYFIFKSGSVTLAKKLIFRVRNYKNKQSDILIKPNES